MYKTILVTLDATPTDRAIIEHVKKLAKFMESRVVLLHVATGAAAQWRGPDAAGEEVEEGQAYLNGVKAEFEAAGVPAAAELAYGAPPAKQIVKWVQENGCDLVAMSTHGHRLLSDLILGTTACEVRHCLNVPVLLLKAT
jgi:nucleotide-binding universal stress UspA family protein